MMGNKYNKWGKILKHKIYGNNFFTITEVIIYCYKQSMLSCKVYGAVLTVWRRSGEEYFKNQLIPEAAFISSDSWSTFQITLCYETVSVWRYIFTKWGLYCFRIKQTIFYTKLNTNSTFFAPLTRQQDLWICKANVTKMWFLFPIMF